MDAKNIYIATSHMKTKIDWNSSFSNEWSFVGEGKDFKEVEVQEFIDSFFSEGELYIVINRHHAYEIPKREASSNVKVNLQKQDVTLSNKTFDKMIEFNYIGVAKHGAINS